MQGERGADPGRVPCDLGLREGAKKSLMSMSALEPDPPVLSP